MVRPPFAFPEPPALVAVAMNRAKRLGNLRELQRFLDGFLELLGNQPAMLADIGALDDLLELSFHITSKKQALEQAQAQAS
jgi:hypothetical protein